MFLFRVFSHCRPFYRVPGPQRQAEWRTRKRAHTTCPIHCVHWSWGIARHANRSLHCFPLRLFGVYFDLKVMPSTQPETLDRACSLLWQATERPSSAITGTLQLFWAKGGISVPSLGVFYVCSSISVSFYSIPLLLSSDN